jgi:hypothetical protein
VGLKLAIFSGRIIYVFRSLHLVSSRLQTGVLPRLTTYFGPRTDAGGFTGTSCASTTQLTTAAGVRGRWSASLRSNKRCSGELEKYAIEVTESLLYAVIGASSYSAFLCRNLEGGSSGKINVEMVDAMPYHLPRILLVRLALNYDGLFRPAHRERPAVDR